MSTASSRTAPRRARPDRGPWTEPAKELPPACPGCSRSLTFSQPDPRRPGEILGTCDNKACREWVVLHQREEGRWTVMDRIPADRRSPRKLVWTPARPATEATARRG